MKPKDQKVNSKSLVVRLRYLAPFSCASAEKVVVELCLYIYMHICVCDYKPTHKCAIEESVVCGKCDRHNMCDVRMHP